MARVFLGQAIENPVVINGFGRLQLINDKELIKQAILDRLLTQRSSEFFNRHNGSIVNQLIFQPNTAVLLDLLESHIKDTIENQERRVKYLTTDFFNDENDGAKIHCKIKVQILQSSEIFSFVFPFYRELES